MVWTLYNLPLGSQAYIEDFTGDISICERLFDLGFIKGAKVEALFRAPLGGSSIFRVENTTVALRDEESQCVSISAIIVKAANI